MTSTASGTDLKSALRARRIALIVALVSLCLPGTSAAAQDQLLPTWQPNGEVQTMVSANGLLYIGGEFTYIGPLTGSAVPLNTASGEPLANSPRVIGNVFAVAADGAGGWYLGGQFTSVGGLKRHDLAHVLADGDVDRSWNPNPDNSVWALAVSGSTVYVGGDFNKIAGKARTSVAAITAGSGRATAWNPALSNRSKHPHVGALAVSGSTVYVGGDFNSVGGRACRNLAAVNATTGRATGWHANADDEVDALAVKGSTVYAGGFFKTIAGRTRKHIAAINATTGRATSWNPDASRTVWALAVSGSTLYAGGDFNSIGGKGRSRIAAIDSSTGRVTAWNPDANNSVYAIAVSGSSVYAGGAFTRIGGQNRNSIAQLDVNSARARRWNPNASNTVEALAVSSSKVYAGGYFQSIGGVTRTGVAAINPVTGKPTSWDPNLSDIGPASGYGVGTVAVSDGTVYIGGDFKNVDGQPRDCLAAIDAATGRVTAWNPAPSRSGGMYDPIISAVAVSGSTVYAGGQFDMISGQRRTGVAAIDAATGQATSWNPALTPGPNGPPAVTALGLFGSTVYASGAFTSIGGQPRNGIGAIDATTGQATSWNPGANGLLGLVPSGSTLYVAGNFGSNSGLAAVDESTGQTTAWIPIGPMGPSAIAVSGTTAYAVGGFGSAGGQPCDGIAAFDASTGQPDAWSPTFGPSSRTVLESIAVAGSTLYVGGYFATVDGQQDSNLAAFDV